MKNFYSTSLVFITVFAFAVFAQAQSNRQLTLEDGSQNTDKRTALVIGNSNYETSPLKNPVNDATDMAAALRDFGFAVTLKTDLTQNDMKKAIREFGQQLKTSGGVGLFYFAGHGVQVKSTNYLVPIDAKVENEEEVEYEAVDAGFVLAQMEAAKNTMNIVILDACRNNPFARSFRSTSRGLAMMDAPSGVIIAYATAPGSVASDGSSRNGLYTQELLKFMRTSGTGIEDIFKQVRISVRNLTQAKQTPWESSSLIGSFYFSGSPQPVQSPPNQAFVPLKFYWEYKGEPEPGKRIWYQYDAMTWIEQYPSGFESVFNVVGRATVNGNKGFVVRKAAGDAGKTLVVDNTFEVFIPDKEGSDRWLRFRHLVNGKWQEWNYMGEITFMQ